MLPNQSLSTPSTANPNPMKDVEVASAPEDSVSALAFSPTTIPQTLLVAGSWDNQVRCWEVEHTGKTIPKAMQTMDGPILDVCWSDDGTKVFIASCDKIVKCWDLAHNAVMRVAVHDAPVKTVHLVKNQTQSCIMTGSWDKTLKFWDTRSPNPVVTVQLPERCYCADVEYPMAVVGTAGRGLIVYQLDGQPREYKRVDPLFKYEYSCLAIFKDKKKAPTGFALGGVDGRVAIQYVNPDDAKDNFIFKCHRSKWVQGGYQDIHAVNDVAVHPVHGTLATVGSDGTFSFWNKDTRTNLKHSEPMGQAISKCAFNHSGQVFAYSVSYDWAKGHEFYDPSKKNYIFLRSCYNELKPRKSL